MYNESSCLSSLEATDKLYTAGVAQFGVAVQNLPSGDQGLKTILIRSPLGKIGN